MKSRRRIAITSLTLAALVCAALGLQACGGGGSELADNAAALLARSGSGASAPWHMFGNNSLRTARSEHRGPDTSGLLWRYSTATCASEPAIAADGTIYVATLADSKKGKGSLYAVRSNGTRRWAYSYAGAGASPVVGGDGTVYFTTTRTTSGAGSDRLFALTSGGQLKWSYLLDTGSTGWASQIGIAADGAILVSSLNGYLYAINPNGTLRWTFGPKGSFRNAAAVGADGTIYVGCWDSHLYAINPDGTPKWSYPTVGWASGPSIGADGTIYVGTAPWLPGADPTPGVLHAINPDGSARWTQDLPGATWWHPAIAGDGTLIVMCTKRVETDALQNAVCAVNADGSFKWSYDQNSNWNSRPVTEPVVDADGTAYIGYQSGPGPAYAFIAVDASGSLKWTASLNGYPWLGAAIGADGTVYVGGRGDTNPDGIGGLFAFGPGTP